MDPLTLFVFSIVGAALASDALASHSDFAEHYRRDWTPTKGLVPMQGHNVTWWVEPGEAIWVKAEYLRPTSGNIFYEDKLGAISRAVRNAEESLSFLAPFGYVEVIGPSDIAESIMSAEWHPGRAWTTGDEELDEWLVDPEAYIEDRGYDEEEAIEIRAEMGEMLTEAVRDGWGDLGELYGTVQDGNHRAFGSILGGEEQVAIRVHNNSMTMIKEFIKKGELDEDNTRLLAEMIEDTGELARWMREPKYAHPVIVRALKLRD